MRRIISLFKKQSKNPSEEKEDTELKEIYDSKVVHFLFVLFLKDIYKTLFESTKLNNADILLRLLTSYQTGIPGNEVNVENTAMRFSNIIKNYSYYSILYNGSFFEYAKKLSTLEDLENIERCIENDIEILFESKEFNLGGPDYTVRELFDIILFTVLNPSGKDIVSLVREKLDKNPTEVKDNIQIINKFLNTLTVDEDKNTTLIKFLKVLFEASYQKRFKVPENPSIKKIKLPNKPDSRCATSVVKIYDKNKKDVVIELEVTFTISIGYDKHGFKSIGVKFNKGTKLQNDEFNKLIFENKNVFYEIVCNLFDINLEDIGRDKSDINIEDILNELLYD